MSESIDPITLLRDSLLAKKEPVFAD